MLSKIEVDKSRLENELVESWFTFKQLKIHSSVGRVFNFMDIELGVCMNRKSAFDFIIKHKKEVLNHVLELCKERYETQTNAPITTLKFDNITLTNDCRLVCMLSLKEGLPIIYTDCIIYDGMEKKNRVIL